MVNFIFSLCLRGGSECSVSVFGRFIELKNKEKNLFLNVRWTLFYPSLILFEGAGSWPQSICSPSPVYCSVQMNLQRPALAPAVSSDNSSTTHCVNWHFEWCSLWRLKNKPLRCCIKSLIHFLFSSAASINLLVQKGVARFRTVFGWSILFIMGGSSRP
jgi:hypothetical protein